MMQPILNDVNYPNPGTTSTVAGRLQTVVHITTIYLTIFAAGPAVSQTASLEQTVLTYCADCHAGNDSEGGLDLTRLLDLRPADQLPILVEMHSALESNAMPPEDAEPLPAALRDELLSDLSLRRDQALSAGPAAIHVPIRRMNRFQYNNAVTDLLDLKCVVFTLPERMLREHSNYFRPDLGRMPDVVKVGSRPLGKSQLIEARLDGVTAFPQDLRAEHGFDNRADHLSLSPMLMEAFLKLGTSIMDSPDFTPRNVGVWNELFSPPTDDEDVEVVIRQRLERVLTKAFRRPASDGVIDRYTNYTTGRLRAGNTFSDAMKASVAAIIASPKFLYLFSQPVVSAGPNTDGSVELQPESTSRAIDQYALAARLSFFLWGSIPDDELQRLAGNNSLSQPEVLRRQVERMLKDRKLKRFCDSFPAQWLQLERLISSVPDPEVFPDFYFSKYRDSMHMMLEPLLLFEAVLVENRSILQFVDSDFTYRSGLLQNAYGELANTPQGGKANGAAVGVIEFRRAVVSDRRTGGVITNAAVMTMTSGPSRTQPITRGAWLASVIFNDPPDPPPADVPPLEDKPDGQTAHLTLRERLAIHRERSDCRGCHEQIDPLGFALENYDPIGRWRDRYDNGRAIDVAGALFRVRKFENVVEFKDAILQERERFGKAFAGHLLAFALARELTPYDIPVLEKITLEVAQDGYRFQDLLTAIVLSDAFTQF